MQIWEQAAPIDGWNMVKDGIPAPGTIVEIMHFGNWPDSQIYDTATVNQWGICPHAKDGGHGKASTVTHWRPLQCRVISCNTLLPCASWLCDPQSSATAY